MAVQLHHHFDLTCQQEVDCFISCFYLFLGACGWVTVFKFIVTHFFGEESPGDADLFAILDISLIQQCNNGIKTLCFSCLMCFPNLIQAFIDIDRYSDYFGLIFGLLRIEPEFFQFTSIAFQKVLTQSRDFRFFWRFFENFMRHEKSCFSVALPWFSEDLTCLISYIFLIFRRNILRHFFSDCLRERTKFLMIYLVLFVVNIKKNIWAAPYKNVPLWCRRWRTR